MITRKTWSEFKATGLLWWANRTLHLFGWAIVFVVDTETDEVQDVYPARVKFRGFEASLDSDGFVRLTSYLEDTIAELKVEAEE